MSSQYISYSSRNSSGGGGSGVSDINGLTGGVTIAPGSNITITPSGNTLTIASTGGSGGITSINTDTTAAQLLVTATTGTNFTIVTSGGTTTFAIPSSSAANRGLLTAADWSTFNAKQNALTIGNLTDTGTDGIVITGGTGAVIGSGTSIAQHVADASHNGYLSSTDWSTFNAKQPAGSFALTNLSNLASVAVNTDIAPASAGVTNLGSSTNPWQFGFFNAVKGTATSSFIDLTNGQLRSNSGGALSVDYVNRNLVDSAAHISVDYQARALKDTGGSSQIAWSTSGIVLSQIVASSALTINASNIITSSSTTDTELAFVHGVTSAIQTQLNGKQGTLTIGNLTDVGTDGITVTGGTGSVIGSGTSISQHVSDATHNGYLSLTDWNTFNNKQTAGNYITDLIGDITASGPGSAVSTVAKIQGTVVSGTTGATNVVFSSAPTLTNPVVGTQATTDSSTKAASTAFVTTAIANAVAGINPAVAVQAATTSTGDTSTYVYNNGVSGIGATLTAGSNNVALTVDGYTFTATGQRLLVKNDTQSPSGAFNGIYLVTQIQTAILPVILTRALDYDMPSDINNTGAIPVINGTVNGTTSWVNTAQVTTVGTDPLSFTKFTRNPADYLLKANNLSDVASASASFINISPLTTAGDIIYESAVPAPTRLAIGSTGNVLTVSGGGLPTWAPPATSGTVTSVALADGSSTPIYSISGSPVTSTGTLTLTLGTQPANMVFAGPTTGANAQPTFRSLVQADIPALSPSTISLTQNHILVGNASNVAADVAMSGDVSIVASGATSVTKIQGTTVSGTTGSGNVVFSASPTLTGTITAAAANFSGAISASNFSGSSSGSNTGDQTITLTGDVTGSGTGSFATTIANNAVSNAKLAQMTAHTYKGNNTGSTANALDVTSTQLTADLNLFTSSLQGLTPASGGGTTNFLRADGTWATPSGGGSTLNYFAGYFPLATSWARTGTTYADPTPSGSNTLTTRQSSGITVTAAASNLPGLTFTPSSASAVYIVTATFGLFSGSNGNLLSALMTDGTVNVATAYHQPAATAEVPSTTLTGIYVPGTASPVTIKLQLAAGAGAANVGGLGTTPAGTGSIEWTIIQIK